MASRFKKGQSGNPKGRPKVQSKSIGEALLGALDNPVIVTFGGRERTVGTADALLINLVHQAIQGDAKAFRALRKPLTKAGLLQRVEDPSHPTGVVAMNEEEMAECHAHPERIADIVRRARERASNNIPLATARLSGE